MARDGQDTRRRILEAAYREFAAHGLAGARVDRIAEHAKANKRAIYEYFGSKEELFDVVVVERLHVGMEIVPESWDDLSQYAADVFDYYAADPDRARLTMWRQLERPEPSKEEIATLRQKLASLQAARPEDEDINAADLYAVIWAIHHTAALYPRALRAAAGLGPLPDPALRDSIILAARRLSDLRRS